MDRFERFMTSSYADEPINKNQIEPLLDSLILEPDRPT